MSESRPAPIETITYEGRVQALIVRREMAPGKTHFLTGSDLPFQAGFIVYPSGGAVAPHFHKPTERAIRDTCEAILVRSGACLLDLYDDQRRSLVTHALRAGDLVILYGGGHGFRMTEDCVLFEIKQGPYGGLDEKERFVPQGD